MAILTLLHLNEQVEVNDLQISVNHLRVIFDHFCCELNIEILSLMILTDHTHLWFSLVESLKRSLCEQLDAFDMLKCWT